MQLVHPRDEVDDRVHKISVPYQNEILIDPTMNS